MAEDNNNNPESKLGLRPVVSDADVQMLRSMAGGSGMGVGAGENDEEVEKDCNNARALLVQLKAALDAQDPFAAGEAFKNLQKFKGKHSRVSAIVGESSELEREIGAMFVQEASRPPSASTTAYQAVVVGGLSIASRAFFNRNLSGDEYNIMQANFGQTATSGPASASEVHVYGPGRVSGNQLRESFAVAGEQSLDEAHRRSAREGAGLEGLTPNQEAERIAKALDQLEQYKVAVIWGRSGLSEEEKKAKIAENHQFFEKARAQNISIRDRANKINGMSDSEEKRHEQVLLDAEKKAFGKLMGDVILEKIVAEVSFFSRLISGGVGAGDVTSGLLTGLLGGGRGSSASTSV